MLKNLLIFAQASPHPQLPLCEVARSLGLGSLLPPALLRFPGLLRSVAQDGLRGHVEEEAGDERQLMVGTFTFGYYPQVLLPLREVVRDLFQFSQLSNDFWVVYGLLY